MGRGLEKEGDSLHVCIRRTVVYEDGYFADGLLRVASVCRPKAISWMRFVDMWIGLQSGRLETAD